MSADETTTQTQPTNEDNGAPALPDASNVDVAENTASTESSVGKSDMPWYKKPLSKNFWQKTGKDIADASKKASAATVVGLNKAGVVIAKGAKKTGEGLEKAWKVSTNKNVWVGTEENNYKGAFGKETWAGESGLFGTKNVEKVKKIFNKNQQNTAQTAQAERNEKERVALQMLKEGDISQEEYNQILAESEAVSNGNAPNAETDNFAEDSVPSVSEPEPVVDGRDRVDTADL